jgi:hypothetical protein
LYYLENRSSEMGDRQNFEQNWQTQHIVKVLQVQD